MPYLSETLIPATSNRVPRSLALRIELAARNAFHPAPTQKDNLDEERYADKSGTYTKGLKQTRLGIVDPAAYASFKKALASGSPADFDAIIKGGVKTQNGPQGGLAFYLACKDASQISVPPAPELASEEYAAELIELYWASLLRDVAFSDYAGTMDAKDAAKELNALPQYKGPRDTSNTVTPELLFRGIFKGEANGPYLSQFLLQPCGMGSYNFVQKYTTIAGDPTVPGGLPKDYMLTEADFVAVQNGAPVAPLPYTKDSFYLHNGRDLAGYTHGDVLYQAYYVANLVLNSLLGAGENLLNPGNPYAPGMPAATTQNGFSSMGGPDIAATMAAVAGEAIRAVWYLKWWVHLRHRPESGGGIVFLQQTGKGGTIDGNVSNTVLASKALAASNKKNKSWFLSQAFPEGSPYHPAYPTGHGAVAGACITVLKFFYNGKYTFKSPLAPKPDGSDTIALPTGTMLNVNGELNKLASNISFGHGVHAGIHWRSDTTESIRFGEAVALSYLRDQAKTYNERFSVTLETVDGRTETISNQ